jgi:hypothetical protein
MDLKEILAISGQPGLYKFVAQSTRGVIVESLTDARRMNVPSTARVSSMGEIAIFTETEDLPITKVFQEIFKYTGEKPAVSHKADQKELIAFFGKALPAFDRERVHVSDIKKVVQWYNLLLDKSMIDLKDPEEEAVAEATDAASAEHKAPARSKAEKKVADKPAKFQTPKSQGAKAAPRRIAPKV